jgi:hypothetical protein
MPLVSSALSPGRAESIGFTSPFSRIIGGFPTRRWTSLHPRPTALLRTGTRSMAPPVAAA